MSSAAMDELPQALDAERSVLAAMLLGGNAIPRARAILSEHSFYRPAHRQMWNAILALADHGEPADFVTLSAELKRRGDYEAAGGDVAISDILGFAYTTANLEAHCREVQGAFARRSALLALEQAQAALRNPTSEPGAAFGRAREVLERAGEVLLNGASRAPRLVDCALALREAAARPEPEYRSIFRAGGMPLGFYGVAHGPGGIGKTRELLRAIVLRVLGWRWHGWEPSGEPFRPLVLSLEIGRAPAAKLLEAIARSIGGDEAWKDVADQVRIIGAPEYVEPLHSGPAATAELLEVIRKHGCNFVLIDSMSEIKGGAGGEGPEDYAPAIEMLKYVSRVTESHVSVIHHNRRLPAGARDTGTPADQIRGPAAFTNASRWACAMDPYRGKRRINWHRVSFGPTPPDSYFAIDAAGLPHDDTAPEAVARVGEDNRARVLAAIPAVGGITRKEIEVATDLSESAVGDHLRALVAAGLVIKVQAGKTTSYHLPISRPPERTIFGSES